MTVAIKKNKLAPALNKKAQFTFICGRGIDPLQDTLSFAKDLGIIRYAGSSVRLTLPETEEITLCTGGKLGASNHLRENPDTYETIRNACYAASGIEPPARKEPAAVEEAS
jgi:hypothetical protein